MDTIFHSYNWFPSASILLQLLIAVLLGGLVGAEREMANKPAGWRTHMLVSGSAALLTSLSFLLVERFGAAGHSEILRTDPIRIVEAIITGISFLGAGTIFRAAKEQQVHGITTAASLLFTASIGIAVALGEVGLAICISLLTVAILRILGVVEGAKQEPSAP